MSRAAESGSGHQQPLRQMLHVASRLMSALFARRPLLIPSSWISRKTSWTTWLNFEAINISEESPDSKYYNKANIHVVVGGLRGKW
eukprot:jgi/Botrbrau1/6393/Bobra.49_1s0011.1